VCPATRELRKPWSTNSTRSVVISCDLTTVELKELSVALLFSYSHTHMFNVPLSGTTRLNWHQLGHMQVCTLLQTDYHVSTPPLRLLLVRNRHMLLSALWSRSPQGGPSRLCATVTAHFQRSPVGRVELSNLVEPFVP